MIAQRQLFFKTLGETNMMANFFPATDTGFALQEITKCFVNLIFCSKCLCCGGKKANKHYKLKPALPTKAIQEAAPLFPPSFWEITQLSCREDSSLCVLKTFSLQQKEACPAADTSMGCISKLLYELTLPDVLLLLEHEMASGHREFLEHPAFYLQGHGQSPPLPVKFIFLHLISF